MSTDDRTSTLSKQFSYKRINACTSVAELDEILQGEPRPHVHAFAAKHRVNLEFLGKQAAREPAPAQEQEAAAPAVLAAMEPTAPLAAMEMEMALVPEPDPGHAPAEPEGYIEPEPAPTVEPEPDEFDGWGDAPVVDAAPVTKAARVILSSLSEAEQIARLPERATCPKCGVEYTAAELGYRRMKVGAGVLIKLQSYCKPCKKINAAAARASRSPGAALEGARASLHRSAMVEITPPSEEF